MASIVHGAWGLNVWLLAAQPHPAVTTSDIPVSTSLNPQHSCNALLQLFQQINTASHLKQIPLETFRRLSGKGIHGQATARGVESYNP